MTKPQKTQKISQESIDEVLSFVKKHIEPDNDPVNKSLFGFDWFYDYFSFISDNEIRTQLAQTYYHSRYMHKLLVGLQLRGKEQYPFLLFQIFEYASIYEALTDYLIEKKYIDSPDFKKVKTTKEIKKLPAINPTHSKIIHESSGRHQEIFFAFEKLKDISLRDIKFSDRIGYVAHKINLTDSDLGYIKKTYDLRNHIHLLKAANTSFSPDHRDGAKAFKKLNKFIQAIKKDLMNS